MRFRRHAMATFGRKKLISSTKPVAYKQLVQSIGQAVDFLELAKTWTFEALHPETIFKAGRMA